MVVQTPYCFADSVTGSLRTNVCVDGPTGSTSALLLELGATGYKYVAAAKSEDVNTNVNACTCRGVATKTMKTRCRGTECSLMVTYALAGVTARALGEDGDGLWRGPVGGVEVQHACGGCQQWASIGGVDGNGGVCHGAWRGSRERNVESLDGCGDQRQRRRRDNDVIRCTQGRASASTFMQINPVCASRLAQNVLHSCISCRRGHPVEPERIARVRVLIMICVEFPAAAPSVVLFAAVQADQPDHSVTAQSPLLPSPNCSTQKSQLQCKQLPHAELYNEGATYVVLVVHLSPQLAQFRVVQCAVVHTDVVQLTTERIQQAVRGSAHVNGGVSDGNRASGARGGQLAVKVRGHLLLDGVKRDGREVPHAAGCRCRERLGASATLPEHRTMDGKHSVKEGVGVK